MTKLSSYPKPNITMCHSVWHGLFYLASYIKGVPFV